MNATILTIFPDLCCQFLAHSLLARALAASRIEIDVIDIRDFTQNVHRTVDDYPYGGGAGMVMKPEPLVAAIESVPPSGTKREVILLSPQGERLTQNLVDELANLDQMLLVCGRYEGVDERVRQGWITREISLGDYVLMGGELPALVLLEVITRKLQGVIGNPDSLQEESFTSGWISTAEAQEYTGLSTPDAQRLLRSGIIEYPHYTRPRVFRERPVPEILLSGNHRKIESWRKAKALKRTLARQQKMLTELVRTPPGPTRIEQEVGLDNNGPLD